MNVEHYTWRVTWSEEDQEYLGGCVEFPSLSWLAATPEAALTGIRGVVTDAVRDMQANDESPPLPLADRSYSGKFQVRIAPHMHRMLALQAAEQGVSLNRWASAKLAN